MALSEVLDCGIRFQLPCSLLTYKCSPGAATGRKASAAQRQVLLQALQQRIQVPLQLVLGLFADLKVCLAYNLPPILLLAVCLLLKSGMQSGPA